MTNISLKELKEKLSDRKWRINNLYYVKDENGKKFIFKMNTVQEYLFDNMWFFNIIPKARQLGITTFFCILYLDQILFSSNKTCVIIAHTERDMKKIFRDKVKFVWDNLHPWIRKYIGAPNTNTANELSFPNGSIISVALSSRGGTVQLLHISEFGKICAKYPDKAEEIVTGAINSVHQGNMVSIESTAEGREGYFYEFCMDAQKMKKEGKELTPFDYKIFFFPWWIDPRYVLEASFAIPREMNDYFNSLKKKYNIELSDAQKRWYVKKQKLNKGKMLQEYPATIEEAFLASIEGAYYAEEMNRVYTQKRIMHLPVVDEVPVDTWWDLGMNDLNIIIFTQSVGPQIRIVDVYYNRGLGLSHYVDILKEKGYRYGEHILPHDVEVRDLSTGLSRKSTLFNLGLTNIRVSPKPGRLQDGIEKVRGLFNRFYFDETRTKPLYEALANYRKEFDAKLGTFKNAPRHDNHSHFCFSGDTIIKTKEGDKKISEIKVGEFVDSPFGWTKVLWSGITGKDKVNNFLGIKITSNHPVLTDKGFVAIDTVRTNDKIMICKKEKEQLLSRLFTMGLNLEDIQNQIGENVGFIFSLLNRIKQVVKRKDCTGIFGNKKKGKFLKDMLFITKMAILLIMKYRTWSVVRVVNINQNTCVNPTELKEAKRVSKLQEFMLQNGMVQKRVLNFISGLVKKAGKAEKLIQKNVYSVDKIMKPIARDNQNTAVENVKANSTLDVYNLQTESGVFFVDGVLVSNCDAVRTGCALWVEHIEHADEYERDQWDKKTDQAFFG